MTRKLSGPVGHRIAALPHDSRGFPVPWFVAWKDGKPLFPVMDAGKLALAVRQDRCWVCGDRLGKFKAFVIGPMCCINRVSAEPPSHLECALFSVKNCPFLTQPKMRRLTTPGAGSDGTYLDLPVKAPAGIMIERNPGVTAIWSTTRYTVERVRGGMLMRLGACDKLSFWSQGRKATRSEVLHSVDTGLPILQAEAAKDGDIGRAELQRAINAFEGLLSEVDFLDGSGEPLSMEARP